MAHREVPPTRRGLRWARPRSEAPPHDAGAGVRTYASPESLFMDQYEPLARALTLISHDPDVARDAVQEAFARLCREWPTVSAYRYQAAWVRRVALNLVRDQQRRAGRQASRVFSLDEMELDPDEPSSDGLAYVDLPSGGNPELWKAVRQLPDKQRTAVGLFYIADLNVSEVAATMRVSQGTVKRHLDRARKTLRTKMEA